jgi:hypothetical protein
MLTLDLSWVERDQIPQGENLFRLKKLEERFSPQGI